MTQTPTEMWRRRRSARLYDTEPTLMAKAVGDASLAANVSAVDRACSGCGYHVCGCDDANVYKVHREPDLEPRPLPRVGPGAPTVDFLRRRLVSRNPELPTFALWAADWSITLERSEWLHGFEGAQAWLSTTMQDAPRLDPYVNAASVAYHLAEAIEQGRISKGTHGWSYRP